ncbi:MAG: hypothetical protein CMN31_03790 [Sandaracinus sp.]|nr:hypothetical protein [Myxococcales bacterium]MAT25158.1 hypothetical protein [Sandaracinus sp.]MBJ70483.1 hypothetical protein [Sandaracinus sp.]
MAMLHRFTLLTSLAALLGCAPGEPPSATHLAPSCAPAPAAEGFARRRSEAVTRLGEPVHSVVDAIALPGESATVEAKLSYGPLSTDLEGEPVAAFLETDECAWTALGEGVTDGDGRVRFEVEAALLGAPGRYAVRVVVLGDGTHADGAVHVLDPAAPLVVFDIDGTLTTSDVELVDGIVLHHVGSTSDELYELAGSPLTREQWLLTLDQVLEEDAVIRPGAVDVAREWEARGATPVYLTGRPYLYDGMTRRWLDAHALPAGPLILVQDVRDSLPARVDGYKAGHLEALQARGLAIEAAYGNAHTDICAYAEAGVPAERTFIVGPNAGAACGEAPATQAVEDYGAHLTEL